jgi:hypothetical protein
VYLREGYGSLFVYCREALRLSEWEAHNRIDVARAARRFPMILGMLAEGSIGLTAVRLLAPHLTPSNHAEVLESARGRTKAEIEEIVARLSPRHDVPSSIRRLPTDRSGSPAAAPLPGSEPLASPPPTPAGPGSSAVPDPSPAAAGLPALSASSHLSPARAAVTALSPDRYKLQVTIGRDALEKLRLAKDMLGHAVPSGDEAAILDRALTALLEQLAKKKFAHTSRPGPARAMKPGARHPSAKVRRAVWLRDLGRCAFVAASGHRCNERRFVEFHHVDPYALGGEASIDGIQLRFRRHNDYEGRLYFGKRRGARGLVPKQVGLSARHSPP